MAILLTPTEAEMAAAALFRIDLPSASYDALPEATRQNYRMRAHSYAQITVPDPNGVVNLGPITFKPGKKS